MPFTAAEFFDVFRRYNEAVWPLQLLLVAAGLVVVVLALRSHPDTGRIAMLVMALLWLWMGVVYHLAFFRRINPAASLFGVVSVVQAALLVWLGARAKHVTLLVRHDRVGAAGALLILYALVLYPVVGFLAGHRYPAAPTFGVPCPTTIFTFALLLWVEPPPPKAVVIIPALWAAIATVAAAQLGVPQDFGLTIAAMIAVPIILFSRRGDALATAM
jgi:hypothetical protein